MKKIALSLMCVVVIFSLSGCFMDENRTYRVQARKYLKSHSDMTEPEIKKFTRPTSKGDIGQERLLELAKSKSLPVRFFAAQKKHLPIYYLEKMLDDKSWTVVMACSWNPNFTTDMFEKLTHHKDRRVRGYLANCSVSPLYLANCTRLPLENLITLSKDESSWVQGKAAKNSRLPETEMRRLFMEGDRLVRRGLAENHKIPMDILITLSEDDDHKVRVKVASNPSLPVIDMRRLFSEKKTALLHSETKRGLAKNPNTPIDILIELNKDESITVRTSLLNHPKMKQRVQAAQNPKLTETEMRRLFREGDLSVRAGLAANPKVPMDILMTLSEDDDPVVRMRVASNPSLPENDIRRLFSEKGCAITNIATRHGLAKNPNTPIDILIELSKDKKSYIRSFASQHPKMKQYQETEQDN